MDYSNIAVVCFGAAGACDILEPLKKEGFLTLRAKEGETARETFRRAADAGKSHLVTVEAADGFTADDIRKVADALLASDAALYIGARKSAEKPSLAANLFGFLSGIPATDATTALYGMSAATAACMVNMKSSDKAFLFNIPLEARALGIDIREVETCAACAAQPGFELLTRSMKLYLVFLKFSIAAMIAYVVDLSTFYLFEKAFDALPDDQKVLYATILSRVLTSITTYVLNRGAVFKSHARSAGVIVRFIILAAVQLIASWLLVWGIGSLFGGSDEVNALLKVIVDLVIFIASFGVSRDWVFRESKGLLK